MRVCTVVGARPQFVKAAAVSPHLRKVATEVLVHTGQHYDAAMSDVFFRDLRLPDPDHHLGVGSGPHGAQTGEMLKRLEPVLQAERPDAVLVYGDTNSTLAGALAAAKLHIPVAHVEAGLRSGNRRMAEEHNRVLTDHLADWLFCPSEHAAANLRREGVTRGVHVVGDVMEEVFLAHLPRAAARRDVLARHGVAAGRYALATVHRAENADDPARLRAILDGFAALGDQGLPVVFPAHPRTTRAMGALGPLPRGVRVAPPLPYEELLALLAHARVVLTDSGGIQKEACWAGVPCVTLRDESEWTDLVASGWTVLAGADAKRIADAALHARPGRPETQRGPVGAAQRVVDIFTS